MENQIQQVHGQYPDEISDKHMHPLKLTLLHKADIPFIAQCKLCNKIESQWIYRCLKHGNNWDCYTTSLCRSCATVPQYYNIIHKPTPGKNEYSETIIHKLTPGKNEYSETHYPIQCNACCQKIPQGGSEFRCSDFMKHNCNIHLHPKCASLVPTLKYQEHSDHPLTLFDSRDSKRLYCSACGVFGGAMARCIQCDENFHVLSCDQQASHPQPLPRVITCHKRHEHPISQMEAERDLPCGSCKKLILEGAYMYACLQCNYFAHITCVITKLLGRLIDKEKLHHSIHPEHPLFWHDDVKTGTRCNGCNKSINEGSAYSCKGCNFFLDKSCLEWPQEKTNHPFHPKHPLKLRMANGRDFLCSCCLRDCSGVIFSCRECDFHLDLECVNRAPEIKFEDHSHGLNVIERTIGSPGTACFRCVECNTNFDFKHCPLPITIRHECHFHDLTLEPQLVEEDINQCYCDACEDKRDPSECIYYCAVCKFEAHVGCVISEVTHILKGDLKDVKLVRAIASEQEKTENESEKDKYTEREESVRDIFKSRPETDQTELERSTRILELVGGYWGNFHSDDKDLSQQEDHDALSLYSDEAIKQFMEAVKFEDEEIEHIQSALEESGSNHEMQEFLKNETISKKIRELKSFMDTFSIVADSTEKAVNIGKYIVTRRVASALEALIAKYGDVSAESKFSSSTKMVFFIILCEVVCDMCDTMVKDVTEKLLVDWWYKLKYVQLIGGFKVHLIFDKLRRVVYAYFGFRADKHADRILTKLHNEITEVSTKTTEVSNEIEVLQQNLKESKERLQSLKIQEKKLKASRSKKSRLMKECLVEIEELVCDSVGEVLFNGADSLN